MLNVKIHGNSLIWNGFMSKLPEVHHGHCTDGSHVERLYQDAPPQRKKLPSEGTGGNTGLIDEAVLIHLDHRFVVSLFRVK